MGLEPVWKSHKLVLVSDGGATFDFAPDRGFPRRLGRYLTVQGKQAAAVRKRWLISNFITNQFEGTYWGIGSSRTSYQRSGGYSTAFVDDVVSEVRTDLDFFSPIEQGVLENHGYLLADAAVSRHLGQLSTTGARPALPHPEYEDEERLRQQMKQSSKRRLLGRWRWWHGLTNHG
jgi:NTE family protein